MNARKWVAVIAILVVSIVGIGWATGLLFGRDARLDEFDQLRAQMSDENLTSDQRMQLFGQMRAMMEGLPEDVQRELRQSGRRQWERHAERRLDEFFALSSVDQRKELDKRIAEEEKRRREREQRGGAGSNRGQNRASGGNSSANPEDRRNARLDRRLDNSSPDMRAKRSEYRRLMSERRKQRGLPPGRGGWGRG